MKSEIRSTKSEISTKFKIKMFKTKSQSVLDLGFSALNLFRISRFGFRASGRQHGFTLIEAITTLAIFMIISTAVVSSIIMLYRGNRYAMEQAIAVENARRGVEQMVRDIREARYSETGAYPIITIGSTTVAIYTDLDRDDDAELVRFYLDGTSFKKSITNPTGSPAVYNEANGIVSVVSENVRNVEQNTPIFEYFNSAGAELTSYTNVTPAVFVKVSLVVNVNPETLPNEYVLRSSAAIRNLKINL